MSDGGAGRESVWDYPRPPRIEASARRVRVALGGVTVAESTRAHRVLETSHPPVYYLPPEDVAEGALAPAQGTSFCEWKGSARYHTVRAGGREARRAAWSYPDPVPAFAAIAGHVAFYPALTECYLDDERVRGQEGGFYGGWVTDEIVGPFKGGPGTGGW
ncbi:MAG: hypothetical protein QOD86_1956 [Miltoncostaeaceae bacterium]|jgi:uncharacterized protein (DUF427 family)|nr:hypothetical protein [Miltoncostaeaceae bacterium]